MTEEFLDIVVDSEFLTIFQGTTEQVLKWLEDRPYDTEPKMIAIGPNYQMLSIGEYKALRG